MQYLAVFFASIAGSLAKRVLLALGIGVVSYAVFSTIAASVKTAVRSSLESAPDAVFQILALSGAIDAVGIWFGALTAVVALKAGERLARVSS